MKVGTNQSKMENVMKDRKENLTGRIFGGWPFHEALTLPVAKTIQEKRHYKKLREQWEKERMDRR